MGNMKALFIIMNAGFADEVIDLAREQGARGATILNARGQGMTQKTIMGITVDSEKEIVLSVVESQIARKIMDAIKEKAGICTPAHGVCFILPVENMTEIQAADAGLL